jgi:hypothetical protein
VEATTEMGYSVQTIDRSQIGTAFIGYEWSEGKKWHLQLSMISFTHGLTALIRLEAPMTHTISVEVRSLKVEASEAKVTVTKTSDPLEQPNGTSGRPNTALRLPPPWRP